MKPINIILILLVIQAVGLSQVNFIEKTIIENFDAPMSIYAYDLEGDGDLDVLGCANSGAIFAWWENGGNCNFEYHELALKSGARVIHADDLDGDGDGDIIGAASGESSIFAWENDGENNFTEYLLSNDISSAHTVYTEDIDRDGDKDILASAYSSVGISWFENLGNFQFEQHIVTQGGYNYPCVYATDYDGDEDIDLIGVLFTNNRISFWNNDGENIFSELILDDDISGPHWVDAKDLDGDGDVDILGTAYTSGQICRWDNDGEEHFTKNIMCNDFSGATSVRADDFDGDGDIDIFGAAENVDQIRWWENLDNDGYQLHIICDDFDGASHVYTADLDNDGDGDILGAARYGDKLTWWANDTYYYNLEGTPLTGHMPLAVQFSDLSHADWTATEWNWDFQDDGIIDSYEQNPLFTYDEPGDYSVRLVIADSTHSREIIYSDYVHVFDGYSALEFDGRESYAICQSSESNNFTDEVTLEAWIKPYGWGESSSYGLGSIIEKSKFAIFLVTNSSVLNENSLIFEIRDTSDVTSMINTEDSSIVLDQWQHVAVTYNQTGDVAIYIDGNEQELRTYNEPSGGIEDNSEFDLLIGSTYTFSNSFEGVIDEVRIWEIARSGEDIYSTMNTRLNGDENGLALYWPMDEAYDEYLFDESGNDNDGQAVITSWVQGKTLDQVAIDEQHENDLPQKTLVSYVYPNPFNDITIISFNLEKPTSVTLDIYDVLGRKVFNTKASNLLPGENHFYWQANGFASGIYFYQLTTNYNSRIDKMVLLK